jgi:ATP-dependent helicase HepA
VAEALRDTALTADADSPLPDYLETVFDCYGIDIEEHSENSLILRPSDQMQHSHFPGLHEEGMTVTFDRETALANEDIHFLSWEHPLVSGAMEMVLGSERGNCAVIAAKPPGVAAGQLLLELQFLLQSGTADGLQGSRYLPPTPVRIVVDSDGNDLTDKAAFAHIQPHGEAVNAETAARIVQAYAETLRTMLKAAETHARRQTPKRLDEALNQARHTLLGEVDRLRALRRVNPNVREEEIAFFEGQWQTLERIIEAVSPRLDALRVIVTT